MFGLLKTLVASSFICSVVLYFAKEIINKVLSSNSLLYLKMFYPVDTRRHICAVLSPYMSPLVY